MPADGRPGPLPTTRPLTAPLRSLGVVPLLIDRPDTVPLTVGAVVAMVLAAVAPASVVALPVVVLLVVVPPVVAPPPVVPPPMEVAPPPVVPPPGAVAPPPVVPPPVTMLVVVPTAVAV